MPSTSLFQQRRRNKAAAHLTGCSKWSQVQAGIGHAKFSDLRYKKQHAVCSLFFLFLSIALAHILMGLENSFFSGNGDTSCHGHVLQTLCSFYKVTLHETFKATPVKEHVQPDLSIMLLVMEFSAETSRWPKHFEWQYTFIHINKYSVQKVKACSSRHALYGKLCNPHRLLLL